MTDAVKELVEEARHHARSMMDAGNRLGARKLSEAVGAALSQMAREENDRENLRSKLEELAADADRAFADTGDSRLLAQAEALRYLATKRAVR